MAIYGDVWSILTDQKIYGICLFLWESWNLRQIHVFLLGFPAPRYPLDSAAVVPLGRRVHRCFKKKGLENWVPPHSESSF